LDLGHAVCIDTYAYGGGWLTCLEPASGRVWMANQRGETRSGWLREVAKQHGCGSVANTPYLSSVLMFLRKGTK
jgi:hypothetical protein